MRPLGRFPLLCQLAIRILALSVGFPVLARAFLVPAATFGHGCFCCLFLLSVTILAQWCVYCECITCHYSTNVMDCTIRIIVCCVASLDPDVKQQALHVRNARHSKEESQKRSLPWLIYATRGCVLVLQITIARLKSGSPKNKKSSSASWTPQVSVPALSHQQPSDGATLCPTRTYGAAVAYSGHCSCRRPCTPLLCSRACIGAEGRESSLGLGFLVMHGLMEHS